jgi:high-affinity Fe2+/Pb2+ permease
MQTKKQSFIEAITNTVIGFLISLAATFFIFPIVGIESTGYKNIIITLFFTVISILRSYVLRRFFNKKTVVKK